MFSMAAFFTAFVFLIVFNERLMMKHYIGMTMLTVAIAVISQSKQQTNDNTSQVKASIWYPISMVVLNSMVHTSITTQGRYWMLKAKINSFDQQMDAFLLHAIVLLILHVWYIGFVSIQLLTINLCLLVGLGSAFNMIGWLLCSEACVNGVAGPAQALCEMQSVWQLFLEIVVYTRIPNLS